MATLETSFFTLALPQLLHFGSSAELTDNVRKVDFFSQSAQRYS
jgi:hypothetical protein